MKFGVRKPSIKKSLSARNPMTQVKKKYSTKKYTDPIGTAKKRAYNKVYNKTTVGIKGLGSSKSSKSKSTSSYDYSSSFNHNYDDYSIEDIMNLSPFDNINSNNEDEWDYEKEHEETMKKISEETAKMMKKQDRIIAIILSIGSIPIILILIFFLKILCWLLF